MPDTGTQYDSIIANCRELFAKKNHDYGTSWRILRPSSLNDQLFIKAKRIRTIEEGGISKVDEGVEHEYTGIVNYCVIGLIQLRHGAGDADGTEDMDVVALFDQYTAEAKALMQKKNHDYGEAWRDMKPSSLTDMILMKLMRMRQITVNEGHTLASEGLDANYLDMLNYAVFARIKISERSQQNVND